MNIKSKWLRLITFIPVLFIIAAVNSFGDAGNYFHDIEEIVADSILKGNPTYIRSENVDERLLKYSIAKNMPNDVACITLGASLVMCIHSEDIAVNKLFNLGMSGAGLYDILGILGTMKAHNKHTSKIILCVDPVMFQANNKNNVSGRRDPQKVLEPYYYDMISCLGINPDLKQTSSFYLKYILSGYLNKIKMLLSLSYFQSSIKYLLGISDNDDTLYRTPSRYGVLYEGYSGGYYMTDSSYIYPKKFQALTSDDVVINSEQYLDQINITIASENEHASEYSKKVFERLIQYYTNNGIKIKLFLCPLAPALWDRFDSNKRPILKELEEFAHLMAEKYSLEITGSYNPYKVHIPNEAFYDSRHIRREALSKYFDFKFH